MSTARRTTLLTAAVMTVAVGVGALYGTSPSQKPGGDAVPIENDRFVVHEWGTFTSFSGSDGVKIEFRPLVDNDLPNFVLDRARQSGKMSLFSKAGIRVIQRMETPITYFYTERERDVRVRVGFPKGLLTEFYPPVESMLPAHEPLSAEPPPIENSELDWGNLHLIPQSHLATDVRDPELRERIEHQMLAAMLPGTGPLTPTSENYLHKVFNDVPNHYYHARETDSAIVHVRREPDPSRPALPVGDYFEKFLFYRGVGNFELPLHLTAEGDDTFVLQNEGPHPVRGLFLVTVDGNSIRYTSHGRIDAQGRRTLRNDAPPSTIDALAKEVEQALVAEGLYVKEARSMVATWRESWFGERGTRLFYIVPAGLTEELLPLHVDPVPDETVRVLVGRMEIMSPEDESEAIEFVRQSAARRAAWAQLSEEARNENPWTPERAIEPLAEKLGRLLEPGIVRARHVSRDPVVMHEARNLMYELTRYFEARAAQETAAAK